MSVLQVLIDTYISNNKPNKMLVHRRNFETAGLVYSEIDGVLNGLKKDRCFSKWHRGTPNYSIEGISQKKLIKVYETLKETLEKFSLINSKSFCRFENDSFIMQLTDGSPATIDFNSRSGNRDMLSIFEVMFEQWKNSAELRNGWKEVIVTKDTLISGLAKKGRVDISGNWIKNTISNIRNLKIKPSKLNNLVSVGYFDRKTKGWPFRIKKPTP